MAQDDSTSSEVMTGEIVTGDEQKGCGLSRRAFVKCTVGTAALLYMGAMETGCDTSSGTSPMEYPIASNVVTTEKQVLAFPKTTAPSGPNSGTGLYKTELSQISQYSKYGYGNYTLGGGLDVVKRYDILTGEKAASSTRLAKLARFFSITDIHITDKEAPNQLIYLQQIDPNYGAPMTSIYSPVMLYTPHVLDAAIQTVNALHKKATFDFGISLGDTCNSTQYNELRWYIDTIDGKVITPSSGDNLGADSIDYQRPFKAAGLNPAIPWYQTIGNHDHFSIGSIPVDADPTLKIREGYISSNVQTTGDVLEPNMGLSSFPCLFDTTASLKAHTYYMGVLDGTTPTGAIKDAGTFATAPQVAADPNRRSLLRTEWIQEFFDTTTKPVGHGLNLVDSSKGAGFACYSFMPKSTVPLKVIVLDDTQSENDGSHDIHGHGFLDAARWTWLQKELDDGQAANQLMIIAAHVPIAVGAIGSEMEWWESSKDPNATMQNAVSLTDLVAKLQSTPNLLMWMAGHRHLNTVKAFMPPKNGDATQGFWQVETSSLRDYPQQLRTFDVYLNDDYTVSIVTVNVDPATAAGTPAEQSRAYAIATQQIIQNNLTANTPNLLKAYNVIPVDTMDPTRTQDGSADLSIQYGVVSGADWCASYNAELFKQLTPTMQAVLRNQFPST